MNRQTIRDWVDQAGAQQVADRCGVRVETVSRWTAGFTIPETRQPKVDEEFYKWKAEQCQK